MCVLNEDFKKIKVKKCTKTEYRYNLMSGVGYLLHIK
jgi:hypothetical protein